MDSSYSVVVEYTYDSWGNHISIKDSNGNEITSTGHIGLVNPFRYRSYYYDNETKLYYLNSRYYNPEMGRFINADGIIGANQDLLGYNLYAYVSNNPIASYDPTGKNADVLNEDWLDVARTLAGLAGLAGKAASVASTAVPYIGIAVVTVGVLAFISSNSNTQIKVKPNPPKVEPKLPDLNAKVYQIATVQSGWLQKGPKLNYYEAQAFLRGQNIASPYQINRFSGIYTENPGYALALAATMWDTGVSLTPEIHNSGHYWHYHDEKHKYHIWFGNPVNY